MFITAMVKTMSKDKRTIKEYKEEIFDILNDGQKLEWLYEMSEKLCDIETLVNRYSTNDYYYKYDNKYLKSEIISDLLKIIDGENNE